MSTNGDHAAPEPDRRLPPVVPHPVPTAIALDLCVTPDKRYVILEVFTPSGTGVYFLEPEIAFAVAKNIRSAAQAVLREPDAIEPVTNRLVLPNE